MNETCIPVSLFFFGNTRCLFIQCTPFFICFIYGDTDPRISPSLKKLGKSKGDDTMKVNPEDSLKIENIVASAKVCDYLDLPALASKIKDAEYNKKRFPGVVLRMQNPKIAALVFGSGKVVLTGAKSVDSLSKGLTILGNQLRSLDIDIPKKLTYKIQNIVTSADLATAINLNKIAVGFNLDRIEYEPEQFPGLVYRLENPKVVVLLFGSGRLIITGGKEPEDAKKAVIKILADLRSLGLM